MVWWIQTLEITHDGQASGKYRLTATSDEDGGGPFGLCDHEHNTPNEADECVEARNTSSAF
jgi:hypothetical protein